MHRLLVLIAVAATAITAAPTAMAEQKLSFAPAEVVVRGRILADFVLLQNGMKSGHILYLVEPIAIRGNKESDRPADRKTIRNVDRILLNPVGEVEFDSIISQCVAVRGRLFNAPQEEHHTIVQMSVAETILISEEDCRKN